MKSIYRKVVAMLFCIIGSAGLIIFLFQYAQKANHKNNAFIRLFPPHFLANPRQLELPYNSFYLAGLTRSTIYLGNSTASRFLLRTNYDLTDTGHILLQIPDTMKAVVSAIKIIVDSPNVYFSEGLTPKIMHGNLGDQLMFQYNYAYHPFDAISIISSYSFVSREYDENLKRAILVKTDFSSNQTRRFLNILEEKGDGIFSLDGMLIRDPRAHQLAYVYYYRNEFLVMDTNLNILLKGKTIDSVKIPEIKLSRIVSSGTITFSSPPLVVNRTFCMDSGYLYVNSRLKAKNEDDFNFNNNSVIDIYSLKTGHYIYSFYIPNDDHQRMKSFRIYNHKLLALYEHSLMTFTMQYL